MRIAINTRFLLPNKMEGFGWYTYETVKRIVLSHPEHEFCFFFDRKFDDTFLFADNVVPVVIGPPARHPILFKIWFNRSVTKAIKKYQIDAFISPDGYLSLKTDVPQLAVIHDLNFEHYPEDIPASPRKYLRTYFPKFAKRADIILTVSNFSKQDLVSTYGVCPEKIDVAYNGVAPFFKPISNGEKDELKKELTAGADYFVFVGSLHPRKNLARLLKSFDLFKEQDDQNFKLLVVGASLWGDSFGTKLMEQVKFKEDVLFTGHISSEKLHKTIASAYAMTFVSYFEGFGIPVAEAMTCGVPVILSDKTSLPEVGGEVAIYVDPFDETSISNAMIDLANDPDRRVDLALKSIKQGQKFTRDKSAEGLCNCFEKMAQNNQKK